MEGCGCELLTSGLAGAAAFPTLLAASQAFVFRPLKVSLGPGLTSPLLGLASVAVASFGASLAALKTLTIVNQYFSASDVRLSLNRRDLLISTASGVVLFRALGGRFGAVLPSNLMRPGAFAAEWLPAMRESEVATPKERTLVRTLGARHGCHSCGEKRGVDFVADHQPPSRLIGNHRNAGTRPVNPSPFLQRFYPQCRRCSAVQGGILGGGNGQSLLHPKAIRTHATSFRPYHLFLPVPFVVAYLNETNRRYHMLSMPQDMALPPSPQVTTEATRAIEATKQVKQAEKEEERQSGRQLPQDVWLEIEVALNFPLFLVWRRIVHFIDSFDDPVASFHMTLWAFTIVAAIATA